MSSVTRLRPYRNGDPPALAQLWNRGLPAASVAHPLTGHDLDLLLFDKPHFDRFGLIVAERDDRLIGFVHSGFGPLESEGPSHQLDTSLGTIALLVVDPEATDPDLEQQLMSAGESYLAERGAQVIYAGGQYPLNPFYWGLYGGSEWAGILSSHTSFHRAVTARSYEPVSTTILLEADLTVSEPRDRLAGILRRQSKLELIEDPLLSWWDSAALGLYRPVALNLRSKTDDTLLAEALVWTMRGFESPGGLHRLGLARLDVPTRNRRRGFGRFLVGEIFRYARSEDFEAVAVQTRATNLAALQLYASLNFVQVESSTLYRRPASV